MRLLAALLLPKDRSFSLRVYFAHFGVGSAKVIDAADIHLTSRILRQIIDNIVTNIFDCFIAAEWYSADGVTVDVIKEGHGNCITNIFKYFLTKGRTICVRIYT